MLWGILVAVLPTLGHMQSTNNPCVRVQLNTAYTASMTEAAVIT